MPFDNNVKSIDLNACQCGRKAHRSIKKGYSRLGTPWYREAVSCYNRRCTRVNKNYFSSTAPNKAAKQWNDKNPILENSNV